MLIWHDGSSRNDEYCSCRSFYPGNEPQRCELFTYFARAS
jgi:hypothetical protein